MNENLHQRAQKLLAESLVEGIAATDQAWLAQHLRECPDCSHEATATQDLLQALRGVPVAVPRDLVARTQLRVRLRAQEATNLRAAECFSGSSPLQAGCSACSARRWSGAVSPGSAAISAYRGWPWKWDSCSGGQCRVACRCCRAISARGRAGFRRSAFAARFEGAALRLSLALEGLLLVV